MRLDFGCEVRAVMTLADGTEKVIECVSIEVAGAVTRRAPAAKTLVEPKEKAKRYPVPALHDSALLEMLKGRMDDEAACKTAAHRERVMFVVCEMRRRAFKLGAMTYSVNDMAMLGAAMSAGLKPSTMAKAIGAASRDAFWRDHKDIPIRSLVEQAERLAAAYQAPAARDRAADLVRKLGSLDATAGEEAGEALRAARTDEEIEALGRELYARLAKMRGA